MKLGELESDYEEVARICLQTCEPIKPEDDIRIQVGTSTDARCIDVVVLDVYMANSAERLPMSPMLAKALGFALIASARRCWSMESH